MTFTDRGQNKHTDRTQIEYKKNGRPLSVHYKPSREGFKMLRKYFCKSPSPFEDTMKWVLAGI